MKVLDSHLMQLEDRNIFYESAERVELIEQLLAIGMALSSSQNLGELLNLILSKSREITCSDAGSVYLMDNTDEIPKLLFKAAQNDSQPYATLEEFAIPLSKNSLAGYVALTGRSLNLSDAYNLPPDVPYQLDKSFDSQFCYRTRSVLILPMQDQDGEITGVLQLINRKIAPNTIVTAENVAKVTQPYTEWEERIVRSLASQAAISIERNQLQKSIENLFEGFVKASVELIEMRDPTTSGHSERVAKLSVRLAEEVNLVNMGPLRSVYFTDRHLQEIRYAALLHDFGKVCVPEAILGKRKKLYPEQLEVMRHRFALTRRTLEMECAESKFQYLLKISNHLHITDSKAESICPYCKDIKEFDRQLDRTIDTLDRYWDLIVQINEPETLETEEFRALSEEALVHLTELSKYTYRDIDGQLKPLVTLEEMTQLMLPRGNLTLNERLSIEAHVTHSYKFLQRIPWTKHLKNLPAIAYKHHEKLDGSGYPQGLKQPDIPIQTQILTISDIYDALTASDRPYKRRLPVETSLQILRQEASKNKINQDLVELFAQRQIFSVFGHSI